MALEVLESQDMLKEFLIADYPHKKIHDKQNLYNRFHSKATPFKQEITVEEFIKGYGRK